jgi:aspartate kinase
LLLIVDENTGWKDQMKEVVQIFFEDHEKALQLFKKYRSSIFQQLNNLDFLKEADLLVISDLFVESEWILEDEPQDGYAYVHDQIVAIIPLVISRVVAAFLNAEGVKSVWIDNRDFVLTDEKFMGAAIDYKESAKKWQKLQTGLPVETQIIVIQNGIGSTQDNATSLTGEFDVPKFEF